MNYTELNITIAPKEPGSEVLIAELSELGFDSFVDTPTGINAYITSDTFSETEIQQLFQRYSQLFSINYSHSQIEQQNWNKEWESNFEPIQISNQCIIRAPFHQPAANITYDIIIEPKMSFGTGHHTTTQLMAGQLLKMDVSGQPLLDMGCGTGVLAILAAKKQASPITAIDIDDWSYENCIENLAKNNVTNVAVHKGDVQILAGKVFRTILANINKNVLLADMPLYVQSLESKGSLVISGFFETDIPELTQKATTLNLQLATTAVSNQWAMLHFIKN